MASGTDDQQTKGTDKALPCPWCGDINGGLDNMGVELRVGMVIECDHCSNYIEFTAVNEVVHIRAERHGEMRDGGHLTGGGK